MTMKQVEELKRIESWDREHGITAFCRRHGLTVPSVYHWRRKLGLPVAKWCGRSEVPRALALAFLLLSSVVQAAGPTATLTITPSLTNTDGSTITSTLTCNVYQGPKGAEGAIPVQTGIPCNSTATVTITAGLTDGSTVCFQATEVEGGQESAKTVEGCKTFPPATPTAPSLTVQ